MKKSKLSAGLVTSFIAAMSLGACSSNVTANKNNIVDFTGYNDQSLAVVTDTLYDDYKKSSSGISAYYNQVIEVLIRHAFAKNELDGVRKTYTQIVNEAKDNVKSDKQSARESADTNGTSYKTEWQSSLKSKGVKDEAELLQYYIYKLEKEVIEDWYYDKHEESLRSEYIGVDKDGKSTSTTKASSRYPYHIRHILVKVEDGASDFARGTISSSQAKLLSETIQRIAEGKLSFGQIALQYSEDGSASSYGDVGIVTSEASSGTLKMVNEFQLGIYAYDAVLSGRTVNPVLEEGLGFSKNISKELYANLTGENPDDNTVKSVKTVISKLGLGEVPYSKVVELGLAADVEDNSTTGLKVGEGQTALYPRNILWNKYFNKHNAFVITNRTMPVSIDVKGAKKADKADVLSQEQAAQNNLTLGKGTTATSYVASEEVTHYKDANKETIKYADLTNFKKVDALSAFDNFRVLTDGSEEANVIIGVRSQYGIHLMVVQKSVYDFADDVSLNEYYTTAVPGDKDYPVTEQGEDKRTYVNFIDSVNKSEYNSRSDTVRNAIKGFDSTYDYRLYDELSCAGDDTARQAKFKKDSNGYKLLEQIDNYIALQREKNVYDQGEGLAKVWKTYLELLSEQNNYRVDIPKRGDYRLVPEGCKIRFYSTEDPIDADEYKEGGACYVKN